MNIRIWALSAVALIGSKGVWGQRALDTLYTNESMNVSLFFPNPIKQAVTGHKNFVFSYDREEAGHLGLLQGVEGVESNLLVITSDDRVYAYVLKYAKVLSQLNRFICSEEGIGNVWPQKELQVQHNTMVPSVSHYDTVCMSLLDRKPKTMVSKRKNGIRFRLEDMVHYGREVYLVLEIKNRSTIDFEMGHLEVLRVSGNKKRRSAYQEISMVPSYEYDRPVKIKQGETKRFVHVLPKFVLGDTEHLKIILGELHGNRRVELFK
ncbi:DUF4138 domain-containing protein [Flagellimonas olearia]|uniref:DUF4138 domain-containing protein n=1 Tax=Flagellimonas olearia TaxID=552546 RepID=A0A6I1E367_9FLAO|nr:DUF4138 domain-containing protein [Allomuricauda olearia]KAB7530325.1 DUF4138 domain-containing protein [Allomuricauda olearia]